MFKVIFSLIVLAFFVSSISYAGQKRFETRQDNQQQRIQQGVESGQLTNKEAARLEKEQQKIEVTEDKAKADGVITPAEKKKIIHEQNKASKHIKNLKHN